MIRLAAVFRAMGNPHRLEIVSRLARCCGTDSHAECSDADLDNCVGQISADLGLAPSTTSTYLAQLRRAGLIRMDRRGQMTCCGLEPDAINEVITLFRSVAGQSASSCRR
jgi:ArsR family transcriptional regulator